VGPSTFTLTDDEKVTAYPKVLAAFKREHEWRREAEARVAALTADLADRTGSLEMVLGSNRFRQGRIEELEQVIANVRAQVEAVLDATEWNGWGGRHRLEERIRRALLPAAPTGEER
jgi:hypothetical protein